MIRDILNHLGQKIGELELPDGTSEQVWAEKLAPYAVAPPAEEEAAASYLNFSLKARKEYADGLLGRFKARNISQGINALQGLWMHHRMRAASISFYGVPLTIDVMNLAISGDIEIACLTLMNVAPDDGSQPHHWLIQERIDWLIADMKGFLGWS